MERDLNILMLFEKLIILTHTMYLTITTNVIVWSHIYLFGCG